MRKFENLYAISKTLRFELKPVGKTDEQIKKYEILERDKKRAELRPVVQDIIDERYKKIIEAKLSDVKLSEENLKAVENKEDKWDELKEEIISPLSSDRNLFQEGKFVNQLLKENPDNENLQIFKGYTTYFTNFFDIRKHVFTGDSAGSIAYRLIDENLKLYIANLKRIENFPEELKAKLKHLPEISSIEQYNRFLTQSGITTYNEMLGGFATADGVKIQGINEIINLYNQKHKAKIRGLEPLYKMILSDRTTSSFILDMIENDEEMIEKIDEFLKTIDFSQMPLSKLDGIYIQYKMLGYIPQLPFATVKSTLYNRYDQEKGKVSHTETYLKRRETDLENQKYSLQYLATLFGEDIVENLENRHKELLENYQTKRETFYHVSWTAIKNIKQSEEKHLIKDLLDSLKDLQRFYGLFEEIEDLDLDPEFYIWLGESQNQLGFALNDLYNQTRNYLTKKEFSTEKFKLNFDNAQLAAGWDKNKEKDNSSIILRKFNKKRNAYDYYLGIWRKELKSIEKEIKSDPSGIYEKMDYKLFPDPARMLPKLFHSKKWCTDYPMTEEYHKRYRAGEHKKGNQFNIDCLHMVIDRFKHGLIHHENKYQETFEFQLKEIKQYTSYAEFLEEIQRNDYRISFEKVEDVVPYIDAGKLFVFQIYSKDFSVFSKGTKNLNTIYFESLFSEENIKDPIFKLSGEAELFYRPASLQYSKKIRQRGHHYEMLKDKFNYPIIKDKRYSEDKYFFHVPIEINNNSLDIKNINTHVNDHIEDFTHVIGIDRGERHLIYICVVEIATGKIVEQKNLDTIINKDTKGKVHQTNYLEKLEERSKSRDRSRKSWDQIETIKELKDGYMSQVVNEIRTLQEKYNALIVMENLSFGFKNSRIKVEQQVYQKFELALIKKLNYLIDKKDPTTYLHGKQLTNAVTTLDKIGFQSGVVYYIPAWNTSRIDPVTGFVNLFYQSDLRYKNRENALAFIQKLKIAYNREKKTFQFQVDFSKWNDRYKKSCREWTLTSAGTRVSSFRSRAHNNNWVYEEINLTEAFEEILDENGKLIRDDVPSLKRFMYLFRLMVQLRNSNKTTGEDYIFSPVADRHGNHFDSRKALEGLPIDADANGAFNIARKGLMVIENIRKDVRKPFQIKNEDYLKYVQNNHEKKRYKTRG